MSYVWLTLLRLSIFEVARGTLNCLFISLDKRIIKKKFTKMMNKNGYEVNKENLDNLFKINEKEWTEPYIFGFTPIIANYYLVKNLGFLFGDYSGINRFYYDYFNEETYEDNDKLLYKLKKYEVIEEKEDVKVENKKTNNVIDINSSKYKNKIKALEEYKKNLYEEKNDNNEEVQTKRLVMK